MMKEKNFLRIDSHKLHFHPQRVADWLGGKDVFPIYMEISPTGQCNHRCAFCAFEYLGYQKRFIDREALLGLLTEISGLGVRSIMFAGEGEPLLHPNLPEFLERAKAVSLDAALSTNGSLLSASMGRKILPHLSWMRVSLNAGSPETYSKIHGVGKNEFAKVLKNISSAVELKKKHGFACNIGIQCLIVPENFDEIPALARILKDLGVDYLSVKPYLKHALCQKLPPKYPKRKILQLEKKVHAEATRDFKVILRSHSIEKLHRSDRGYDHCLGLPFFAEVISNGDVYTCGFFLGNSKYCYGNIYKSTFQEIWLSERARKIRDHAAKTLDAGCCMKNCRLDEINRYLWELKHPGAHVNFI